MPTKTEITRRIIETSDLPGPIDVDTALKTWYQNIRDSGGMRLTPQGYKILCTLDIASWSWPWPNEKGYLNKRLLLEMDRRMQYPYFINAKTREIIFYSSREAMMVTLYGDIKSWLNSLVSHDNDDGIDRS